MFLFFSPVVEDLFKRRQPMPSMDVIYFIQPIKEKYVLFIISHVVVLTELEFKIPFHV